MKLMIQVAAYVALAATVCKGGPGYNLPPEERLMAPGPGVGGPGPGVLSAASFASSGGNGSYGGEDYCPPTPSPTVQVMFAKPAGMHVAWDVTGSGTFSGAPLVVPGRTNFRQAGLYRIKLQNIPGHEGMELYPTLEIGPPNPRSLAYLAHNAIPLQLTVDDFNQVMAGNFVTKVIYLPDPDFQELAVAGVETLVSTRLDPGVNPIVEADRRGSILGVLRVGNKDIEMPGLEGEALILLRHVRWRRCFGGRRRWPGRPHLRHAAVRYADRLGRPPSHPVGRTGRFAQTRDSQSHASVYSGPVPRSENPREATAGHSLSGT